MMKQEIEPIFYGTTFDDFLLRPQHSIVKTRGDVSLAMPLSCHIKIEIPIVGANMDTVTREKMMQTLSLEGCFGFLDRNCPIEDQVERVKYIKRQHSFIIENPNRLARTDTIGNAKEVVRSQNVSGLLIEETTGSNLLVGILSHRDILLAGNEDHRLVEEFMTPFKKIITGFPKISINQAEKLMLEHRVEKLPLIDKNRKIKGLITIKDLHLFKQKPYSTKDKKGRLMVGVTVGATGDYLDRAGTLLNAGADCILMDIAHSDSNVMGSAVREFKKKFKNTELVCGNIGTGSGAKFLMSLGVNAVKVGIGPGKGCRTRLEVGAGVPQLQAIREVYIATEGKLPIIADGGVKNDKDIALAILSGASTVMLGSMLSGTDESPGVIIDDPVSKRRMKIYRGMTSVEAVLDGRKSEIDPSELLQTSQAQEGQSISVPYTGSVIQVIKRVKDHLRSAVSYAGESTLLAAHRKIAADPEKYLIKLSESAKRESWDR